MGSNVTIMRKILILTVALAWILTGFGAPAPMTGKVSIILFAPNNFNVPASNITNTVAYSVGGAVFYSFPNNPDAMEIYANGCLLTKGASNDYTAATSGYNMVTPFPTNVTLLNQQTFARMGDA